MSLGSRRRRKAVANPTARPPEPRLHAPVCTILPMPLVTGATAAGYSIVRLLGSGEIGELYLAQHPRLPRHFALKLLRADLSADPDYRGRFKQESNLATGLWHPHIVGLQDRGKLEGRLWLSMDYIDGADTAKLLTDTYRDGMPRERVIEIVSAIADALDYAHNQGMQHLYVNPSNILLTSSVSDRRRILLAGLGVARPPDDINRLTRMDLTVGTTSYAAPEQLNNEMVDGRTDQYALAATAFHLLTGSPPFAHINPAVVLSKQLDEPPPRPSGVKPELEDFDGIFARALAKAPHERYRRCRDFAKALEANGEQESTVADAGAHTVAGRQQNGGPPPSEPAAPARAPAKHRHSRAARDVPPSGDVGGAVAFTKSAESQAATDDAAMTSRRRRMVHTAALGLTIVAVALGGFFGVMALRSASELHDAPTNVDTPTSATETSPAPPAPESATPPPMAPPPAITPPPTSAPLPAVTTTAPVTTTPPPSTSTRAATTVPHTTSSPTSSPTTPPAGLDTRPAIGMPCGATGTTATSNVGVPVACVDTPGGSAWEPPGG
jgi:serine/threonine protein kinase, bacterial